MPARQAAAALSPPAQTVPQVPQLLTSRDPSTSQPSARSLLQSRCPLAQALMLHLPFTQAASPLTGVGQTMAQPPQLLMSLLVSVSQPSAAPFLQSRRLPSLTGREPHCSDSRRHVGDRTHRHILARAGASADQKRETHQTDEIMNDFHEILP